MYSLGHGGNDAQKTMVIAVLLYRREHLGTESRCRSGWLLACQAAMALGTLMGGWRIVRTMGLRINQADADAGVLRGTGGAATLFMATWLGVPVSTTHTSPAPRRRRCGGAGLGGALITCHSIVYAWVITISCSAGVRHWPLGRWRCCELSTDLGLAVQIPI